MANLILIKLNSIQHYVFHSNKLKENIGASHITNKVLFDVRMHDLLKNMFTAATLSFNQWKEEPYQIAMISNQQLLCEVLEIGGGGAMLLFKNEDHALDFVSAFKRLLIEAFPGLKVSIARSENINPSELSVQAFFTKTIKDLKDFAEGESKSGLFNTIPYKSALMENCEMGHFANEFNFNIAKNKILDVSGHSLSKLQQAKHSQIDYNEWVSDKSYIISNELEKLVVKEKSNYIAVVHIDGNGIGLKAASQTTIEKLRKFSTLRNHAIEGAIKFLVAHIITLDQQNKLGIELQEEGGKKVLPIRPLLHGGDDVTFVCEGRLGIYLAEVFIKKFTEHKEVMDAACAGVAIVKTKFPFYKAYELAEQLCQEAKIVSKNYKKEEMDVSILSFYYSSTTFSGSINHLRSRTHRLGHSKTLYHGPYVVEAGSSRSTPNIHQLKQYISNLGNTEIIPRNKVFRLREVLSQSDVSQKLFIKELQANAKNSDLWPLSHSTFFTTPVGQNKLSTTPYFDAIELLDFYPKELL
jgi:hypothetical protein